MAKNKFKGLNPILIQKIRANQTNNFQVRCCVAYQNKESVLTEPIG